jgi:TPR repeat protein
MKAAELGMTKGIFNVGLSYYRGQGVPQSDSEAMKWFMKGAELGHTKSENMVKILRNQHKIISIGLS